MCPGDLSGHNKIIIGNVRYGIVCSMFKFYR